MHQAFDFKSFKIFHFTFLNFNVCNLGTGRAVLAPRYKFV